MTTVIEYALAVSSMVVLVGILQVSQQGSADILDHTGTHFVAFSPADMAAFSLHPTPANSQIQGEGLVAFGTRTNLMPRDLVEKIGNLPVVAKAAAYLQYRFRDPNDGHLFTVGGFDPNDDIVVGTTCCAATDIINGRFLKEGDSGKVVLEQAYAQLRRLGVGDTIHILDQTFTVIGIINPGIRPAKADIYMPYTETEGLVASQMPHVSLSAHANLILVEVKDSSLQEQAIRDVKNLYPDLVISSYACYKPAAKARAINTTAIAMLIAVIGTFTILLGIVSQLAALVERRLELGILKTLGFSNARIMGQIVLESVLQAAMGALVAGAIVLLVLPWLLLKWLAPMGIPVSNVHWLPICLSAIGLSVIGGLLAGLFPAFWAGRQSPASLLRCF